MQLVVYSQRAFFFQCLQTHDRCNWLLFISHDSYVWAKGFSFSVFSSNCEFCFSLWTEGSKRLDWDVTSPLSGLLSSAFPTQWQDAGCRQSGPGLAGIWGTAVTSYPQMNLKSSVSHTAKWREKTLFRSIFRSCECACKNWVVCLFLNVLRIFWCEFSRMKAEGVFLVRCRWCRICFFSTGGSENSLTPWWLTSRQIRHVRPLWG